MIHKARIAGRRTGEGSKEAASHGDRFNAKALRHPRQARQVGNNPWKVRIEPPRFEWEGSNDSVILYVPRYPGIRTGAGFNLRERAHA